MAWTLGGDPYFGNVCVRPWLWIAPLLNLVALGLAVICLASSKEEPPETEYLDLSGVAPFALAALGGVMNVPLVIISSVAG